jgi:Carboxypeptidase regulatory-like domain
VDPSGSPVSGAQVTVTNADKGVSMNAVSDGEGHWVVSNFPGGPGKIQVDASGFRTSVQQMNYDSGHPAEYLNPLNIGSVSETVEVEAHVINGRELDRLSKFAQLPSNSSKQAMNAASTNVLNLQRRVAGVLPVAIDVPRAGTSFQFARALVLDEETKVTFSYKSR